MVNNTITSIFLVFLSKFPKIYSCMAQRAKFKLILFDFIFVHFMLASLASIIIPCNNRFATNNTSWKITSTRFADSVVFTYEFFAISARTFNLLPWSLFWWMLGEYAYGNIDVSLSLFDSPHPFQFDESARTFLITL